MAVSHLSTARECVTQSSNTEWHQTNIQDRKSKQTQRSDRGVNH